MRFSLAVAVVLMGISVSGLAQQSNEFKVKHSTPEKVKQSAALPVGNTTGPGTPSANAKDLQALEHQAAGKSASSQAGGKKTAPALKPVKDQPNPKINFSTPGGAKKSGLISQGSDPYKGRVRHSHQ
jgi:hypothetical protein